MSTILLGSCDNRKMPTNPVQYLKPYHFLGVLKNTRSFRDDDRTTWRRFKEIPTTEVSELQQFLFKAGFMPRGVIDGVFDYVTQASVRLFQEYVRSIESVKSMVPDGIVGNGTWAHINRWKSEGKVSEWGKHSTANPTPEYTKWMNLLSSAKKHYSNNPHAILAQVDKFNRPSDSKGPSNWNLDTNEIHLFGIRRKQDDSSNIRRDNDDIFILLINGLVFKFWGSTDPSSKMAGRSDEAFLVEGQHKYRFGWHKISSEAKVYRALRPHKNGVLVFRDWNDDNALTETDLNTGLDPKPNFTINIHWSGVGSTNFSAGCQVIAGKSYINHKNQVVNCSSFAARSYSALNSNAKKTKGAYNVLTDLMLSFAPAGIDYIYYTLGREISLRHDASLGSDYAKKTLDRMKNI